jgi:hypothetical protein
VSEEETTQKGHTSHIRAHEHHGELFISNPHVQLFLRELAELAWTDPDRILCVPEEAKNDDFTNEYCYKLGYRSALVEVADTLRKMKKE